LDFVSDSSHSVGLTTEFLIDIVSELIRAHISARIGSEVEPDREGNTIDIRFTIV